MSTKPLPEPTPSDVARFLAGVQKSPTCWTVVTKRADGYKQFRYQGIVTYVHRFAYRAFIGDIGDGLEIDHLCNVRNCVNPDHLRSVTPRDNSLRSNGVGAKNFHKTHCPKGHSLEGEVAYDYVKGRIRRRCLICKRATGQRWIEANREKARQSSLRWYYSDHEAHKAAALCRYHEKKRNVACM